MRNEVPIEPGSFLWKDKLYHWSPCRIGVVIGLIALLYILFLLVFFNDPGSERLFVLFASFVLASVCAFVDLIIKWLLNPTTLVLWICELLIIGGLAISYTYISLG